MKKKDENFHSTCPCCNKLIPNQHFDCQRQNKDDGYNNAIEDVRILLFGINARKDYPIPYIELCEKVLDLKYNNI